ncbi:hypothetical protein [Haloflavibacter putidus]|uniref:hypothetical protein n=1 Tax=Haloflavibacter putidus TaxID=2576776 RepID=UPI001F28CF42|nr:hypothetical protein [Haloflavibacter putidus]
MPVKHTPTAIIHSETTGGKTACGEDTNKHPSHWVNTNEKLSCREEWVWVKMHLYI